VSDQQPPTPTDGPAIVDLVLADIHERDILGRQRYGVRLQAHNGRDGLRDAYEESLDKTFYLRLCIEERDRLVAELAEARAEVAQLRSAINTPRTDEFFEAVRLEAAHQVERWGTAHDAGKTPADWFWLIGYLAGKALHDVRGKAAHHVIAAAAALLNWHRSLVGESTAMRPGIEPPP
jgi:hypothetical protein